MTNKPMLSVELQLTEQQERDLTRFYDTCEDSQPYDVPKDRMKSLACVGLVRSLGFSHYELTDAGGAAVEKLRALLDKQAECRCKRYGKDNPHWPCPVHAEPAAQHQGVPPLIATLHENGELITAQATIAQQAKLIELLKGQGEPVAICRLWNEGGSGELTSVEFIGDPCADGTLLYAEQPAPLAVGMPEHTMRSVMDAIQQARGFPVLTSNQCHALAESLNYVARLNGVKP